MKLLDKTTVNTELNKEKRLQIDQGVNIAKKVDALRETLLSLEKQQREFIQGSKTELNKEIGGLISKKDSLKVEVQDLKKTREALLKPLDEAWNEFHVEQDKLEVSRNDIQERDYRTSQKELEIAKQNEKTIQLSKKVTEEKAEALKLLQRADEVFQTKKNEYQGFLYEKDVWSKKKEVEELDVQRRKIEADNVKKEYESYLETIKQKEYLLDLKLRRND